VSPLISAANTLRIATRESRLALWQAEHVADRLRAAHPQLEVLLVPMTTQGDRVLDRSLAQVGGKGLFIKELELAMSEGRADIAVHSMKDVPTEMPAGMTIAAMLPRADARDAFVSNRYASFDSLPHGASVGTSSLRRQCQLLSARPDLSIVSLRGNVDTRLRKLDEGQYDAIVLAAAGLARLNLASRIKQYLDIERCVPAVGQGIVGIECREDDERSIRFVQALNDETSWQCCTTERAYAHRLQGSCQSPIAGHAHIDGGRLTLRAAVGSADGQLMFRDTDSAPAASGPSLGVAVAERLLRRGAEKLLAELRDTAP
jgi:hydroxymethylbilane synthase